MPGLSLGEAATASLGGVRAANHSTDDICVSGRSFQITGAIIRHFVNAF